MFTYQNYLLSDKGGREFIMSEVFRRLEQCEKDLKELREQVKPMAKRTILPLELHFKKVKK